MTSSGHDPVFFFYIERPGVNSPQVVVTTDFVRSHSVFILHSSSFDWPLIPQSGLGVQECSLPGVKRSCTAPFRPEAGVQRGNGRGRRLPGASATSLLEAINRRSLLHEMEPFFLQEVVKTKVPDALPRSEQSRNPRDDVRPPQTFLCARRVQCGCNKPTVSA